MCIDLPLVIILFFFQLPNGKPFIVSSSCKKGVGRTSIIISSSSRFSYLMVNHLFYRPVINTGSGRTIIVNVVVVVIIIIIIIIIISKW